MDLTYITGDPLKISLPLPTPYTDSPIAASPDSDDECQPMLVAEGGVWPGPWRHPTPTMPVAEGHIPVYPYHPEPTTALSAHEKAPTSGSSSTPLPHNRFHLNSAIFQVSTTTAFQHL